MTDRDIPTSTDPDSLRAELQSGYLDPGEALKLGNLYAGMRAFEESRRPTTYSSTDFVPEIPTELDPSAEA